MRDTVTLSKLVKFSLSLDNVGSIWDNNTICWDPQMKLIIVDFKMDLEWNSPFFTPRCNIQVWATIGQGDRPPADQVVKPQSIYCSPSLIQCPLLLQPRIFKGSYYL